MAGGCSRERARHSAPGPLTQSGEFTGHSRPMDPTGPTRRMVPRNRGWRSRAFPLRYCMSPHGILTTLGLLALLSCARPGLAQVGKGHQILIDRGLQLQGLSQDDVYLHLDTFTN